MKMLLAHLTYILFASHSLDTAFTQIRLNHVKLKKAMLIVEMEERG